MENTNTDNSIDFVARHYTPDAFDSRRAWHIISASRPTSYRTRWIAAASVAVLLAASAATTIFYLRHDARPTPSSTEAATDTVSTTTPARLHVEFSDVPLSDVVRSLHTDIGILVVNLPDDNPTVTLSFEGTPDQLLQMLNESTDAQMTISQ